MLLLDEPFGALDAKVRKELRRWLRRLHDEIHVTSVFVTHDQEEALEVADRVVVMNHGRIEQVGTPDEVYDHPANPFVYGFLGNVNAFTAATSTERSRARAYRSRFRGRCRTAVPWRSRARTTSTCARWSPGADGIVVNLVRQYSRGASVLLELERDGRGGRRPLEVEMPRAQFEQLEPQAGERFVVRPRSLRVFPAVHP